MDIDPAGNGLIFGFKKLVLIAGVVGIVLGIVVRRQFAWKEALTAFVAGGSCVLFVAPMAVRLTGFKGVEEAEQLAGWLAGLGGMYIVDLVFAFYRDPFGTAAKAGQVLDVLRGKAGPR